VVASDARRVVRRAVRRLGGSRTVYADVCVVGAGPYSMVRAIEELRAGRSVVVVDRQEVLGGAWAARRCYDRSAARYDIVAHLISALPDTYSVLEGAGMPMTQRRIYYWDAAFSEGKAEALAFLSDDHHMPVASEAGHLMGYHQYHGLQHWPDRNEAARLTGLLREEFLSFQYLEHCFQPVVDALSASLRRWGGKALLGNEVRAIAVEGAVATVECDKLHVRTRKVISGRHLNCSIVVDGIEHREAPVENLYNSLLVLVRLATPPRFRYLNVANHDGFYAVQVAPSPDQEDAYSFCLIGFSGGAAGLDGQAAVIFGEFRKAGILDDSGEILDAKLVRYLTHSHSTEYLRGLERASPVFEFNVVTNLGECIAQQRGAWERSLAAQDAPLRPDGTVAPGR
jgi:glycine/D-amino acid oxidase-like deaminating enzyme